MELLPEDKLIWSDVVANSRMNRQRNASGINSYEKELGFSTGEFLKQQINKSGFVRWADLCCGEGKALLQCASFLQQQNLQHKAMLKGIDLVNSFVSIPSHITCIHFGNCSLFDRHPQEKYNLVTCVHGIHYIGDKLDVLQKAFLALSDEAIFIANFDIRSVVTSAEGTNYIKNVFKQNKIEYNSRKKLLMGKGQKKLVFDLEYEGADDKAGPNYTGQPAVNSHYRIL
jgi:hypothetical protein